MEQQEIDHKILEISPVGMVALNRQGAITYANQEAVKILGLTKKELTQRTYDSPHWKITDFNGLELTRDRLPFFLVINSRKPVFNVEHTIEWPDGTKVYLSINAAPITDESNEIEGVIACIQDVSEKVLAAEKLQKSEKQYQNLFDNLIDEVHVWRVIRDANNIIQSWELVDVNARALKNWGKTKAQVVGRNAIELFGEESIRIFKPIIDGIFETKQPRSWETYFAPTNQYLAMDSIPVGELFISTGRDITDKVKINQDLRKAKEEAERAKEKAEESDRLTTSFLQNLSHEIRTPLNAICGFSQILENAALSDESRKKYISLIQSSSSQLLSIVSDILLASALEKGQEKVIIKECNLNSVLQDLYFVFKQKAEAKNLMLHLKTGLTDASSIIETDETKLIQIVTNLLTNALKFTPEGQIEFGYTVEGNDLQFYIRDTGIGIKPELHELIFERFRQADSSIAVQYGGNGLGLSISKDYVQLLAGRMWLQSEPGKGSVFYFTIPHRPVNKTEDGNQTNNYTILVADDEILNFMVIQGMLMNLQVTLIHAKDGQEAIDLFNENPNINLILMDIRMPRLTGDVAASVIKSLNPKTRIIAQSGYAFENERVRYANVFDDYLTKPIAEGVLISKISRYMNVSNS